jgi:hypothetical protein
VLALGYPVGRVEELPGSKDPDGNILQRRLVQVYRPGTAVGTMYEVGPQAGSGRLQGCTGHILTAGHVHPPAVQPGMLCCSIGVAMCVMLQRMGNCIAISMLLAAQEPAPVLTRHATAASSSQLEDSQSGSRPFMVLLEQAGGLLACCCADAALGHFHIGCLADGPSRSLLSLALLRCRASMTSCVVHLPRCNSSH